MWVFRPDQNAIWFQHSAARLTLPELPTDWFLDSIDALVSIDEAWVPTGGEKALYLRPFMFASESFLGVRSARKVTYAVIASPVGGYFDGGAKPLSVWLAENYTRAATGGGAPEQPSAAATTPVVCCRWPRRKGTAANRSSSSTPRSIAWSRNSAE